MAEASPRCPSLPGCARWAPSRERPGLPSRLQPPPGPCPSCPPLPTLVTFWYGAALVGVGRHLPRARGSSALYTRRRPRSSELRESPARILPTRKRGPARAPSLPCDFLRDVFFSLACFIVRTHRVTHITCNASVDHLVTLRSAAGDQQSGVWGIRLPVGFQLSGEWGP